MMSILGAMSQFESDIRAERQREGIEKAKSEKRYLGRKPSVDTTKVTELHANGLGPSQIARELRISRTSVYRALAA